MNDNRFTERAQSVIRAAHEAAGMLGHGYVGSEHLLIGLLRETDGVAAHALQAAGITEDKVQEKIIEAVGQGEAGTPVQGLTPRTKRIIELAFAEAGRAHHSYVGTEHLLMGILHEGDSVASRLLMSLGADPRRLYGDITNAIGPEFRQILTKERLVAMFKAM